MLPTAANANDAPAAEPGALPELLTVPELAAMLRMNVKSVYAMLPTGKIPGCRQIGRSWRAHRDTVVAWVAGQGSAPPSKKAGRR